MAISIGRVCIKIAGRDAGKKGVVLDIIDKNFVLIDGETRRRKCNILHIEPLDQMIDIKKNASHDDIKKSFKELGITIKDSNPKQKAEKTAAKAEKKPAKAKKASKKKKE